MPQKLRRHIKPGAPQVFTGTDRVATPEEIRTAWAPLLEFSSGLPKDSLLELRGETGKYVRVSVADFELLALIDELSLFDK
jgi:hypothetical protein